jgi:hypothetical protein
MTGVKAKVPTNLHNPSTDERLAACTSYGIGFDKDGEGRHWARHNVAGVLGPFGSAYEAIEGAYNTWVS